MSLSTRLHAFAHGEPQITPFPVDDHATGRRTWLVEDRCPCSFVFDVYLVVTPIPEGEECSPPPTTDRRRDAGPEQR